MGTFSEPHFHNDGAARIFLESVLWPDGPICPKCGTINHAYATKKPGVFRCAESDCRKDFTVTMNTVMERSHIVLHKWLQAFHLMTSSKKGVSAHQLHRTLDISYEAAWFMAHRIREAMRTGGLAPMGGGGNIVEADETYYGPADKVRNPTKRFRRGRRGPMDKRPILALVERGGKVRTFHVPVADKATVHKIVTDNVDRESRLHTDESKLYGDAAEHFEAHETVKHTAKEYVRREFFPDENNKLQVRKVHTNSAEGYFSIFKKGMHAVYQHCAEKHLHRYLAEFDFRYNNRVRLGVHDGERAALAIKSATGKRLTYHLAD